jgi:hypothetical protein
MSLDTKSIHATIACARGCERDFHRLPDTLASAPLFGPPRLPPVPRYFGLCPLVLSSLCVPLRSYLSLRQAVIWSLLKLSIGHLCHLRQRAPVFTLPHVDIHMGIVISHVFLAFCCFCCTGERFDSLFVFFGVVLSGESCSLTASVLSRAHCSCVDGRQDPTFIHLYQHDK